MKGSQTVVHHSLTFADFQFFFFAAFWVVVVVAVVLAFRWVKRQTRSGDSVR